MLVETHNEYVYPYIVPVIQYFNQYLLFLCLLINSVNQFNNKPEAFSHFKYMSTLFL